MRVAFVASEYPPYVYGGLGTHVAALSAALAARGVEVDIFLPDRDGYHAPPPGVCLCGVPTRTAAEVEGNVGLWADFGVRALAELARRSYDLVHCHDWMAAVPGAGAARRGVPVLFSVHLPQADPAHLALERLGLASASAAIVAARAVAGELLARDARTPPLAVIPNGVDTTLYRAQPPRTSGLPSVLFVGRLVAQKGVDVLLHAFAVLRRRLPDARLTLVGDGDQALYLRRLARYLGIMPAVEFAGWRTGEALVRAYGGADVVTVPSRYEPFGLVALEAMACARPVVASRVGGLAEIVDGGPSGVLVPPGDHLKLAQAVAGLLLDPERRAASGQAAREQAERSGWSEVAAATLCVYEDAMRAPRTVAPAEALVAALPDRARRQVSAAVRDEGEAAR